MLDKFQHNGIPPAPRRVPRVEVASDVGANGILNMATQEKSTGKKQPRRDHEREGQAVAV